MPPFTAPKGASAAQPISHFTNAAVKSGFARFYGKHARCGSRSFDDMSPPAASMVASTKRHSPSQPLPGRLSKCRSFYISAFCMPAHKFLYIGARFAFYLMMTTRQRHSRQHFRFPAGPYFERQVASARAFAKRDELSSRKMRLGHRRLFARNAVSAGAYYSTYHAPADDDDAAIAAAISFTPPDTGR